MARLIHPIGYRFTSASGSVLASGTVETYLANTSTPQAVYQDPRATSALSNPISLNASGQAQNASGQTVALFAPDVALKWILKDSAGSVVNTIDDDGGAASTTGAATAADGGMRNLLSNGEMRLWLDTSTPVDWSLDLSGATGTISRQTHTLGQTDVPGEPLYYQRLTVTASNADAGVYQDVDDVRTLAGQDAAASVYVRCSVTTTLRLALVQKFGTGGSPSADVSASTDFNVSANVWTRLEMPKTLASVAGKTLGSNADSSLRFALTNPNNETFTLDLGGAQLERASEVGALEHRLPHDDALLAARPEFTSLNGTSPHEVGRNILVNGGFDVWQRGTSFAVGASASTYTADRWIGMRGSVATGLTVSRVTGEADAYAAKLQRAASDTSVQPIYLVQTLPNAWCQGLAGNPVSVSVRVRAGANYSGGNFKVIVFTGTGTDQSSIAGFSGLVYNNVIDAALTTSNQTLTGSFTVAAGVTQMAIWQEWTPSGTAGADDSVTVEFAKIERGATVTPYAPPEPVAELARCQAFYRTWGGGSAYDTGLGGFAYSTTVAYFAHAPAPKMRATPTLSVAGSWELVGVGGVTAVSTIAAQYLDATTSVINAQTTGLTAGAGYYLRAANDTSARINLSAEL